MRRLATAVALLLGSTNAALAASSWRIEGEPGQAHYRLHSPALEERVAYSFECRNDGVLAIQTGVTELLDVQTGKKVGDAPGSLMTPGAARMMLMADPQAKQEFMVASASANPVRGWDLSVLLAKDDPQWLALPKSSLMTMMTTGRTVAVALDGQSRKAISEFVVNCGR